MNRGTNAKGMARLTLAVAVFLSISMLAFATTGNKTALTGNKTALNISSSVSHIRDTVSTFPALGVVFLIIGIAFAGAGFWALKQPARPEKKNLRILGIIAIFVGVSIIFSGVGMLFAELMMNSMFDAMRGMGAPIT